MTWTINLNGHDNLSGDEKITFEENLVEKVRDLVNDLIGIENCVVTTGFVSTNSTGTVNLPDLIKSPANE